MKNRLTQTLAARVLLGSLLAAGAVPARADAVPGMYWTHTGSTGTVDPADLPATSLSFDVITNVGPAVGTVDVRYNVVAVDGLEPSPFLSNGFDLVARYRDHGSFSQVVAKLYRVSIATGARTLIAQLDSDAFPQAGGFQTQQVAKCGIPFDFTRNTYFVNVQLVRAVAPGIVEGLPALAALQIKPTVCLQ
jgi:hypothetical protein